MNNTLPLKPNLENLKINFYQFMLYLSLFHITQATEPRQQTKHNNKKRPA